MSAATLMTLLLVSGAFLALLFVVALVRAREDAVEEQSRPASAPPPPLQSGESTRVANERGPVPSRAILVFSCIMLAAFFMPWFQLFGAGISGYNLGRLGSYGNLAWLVPVLAGVTIVTSLCNVDNRVPGIFTGLVPLVAVGYGVVRLTSAADDALELLGHVTSIGVYVTLICSVALLVAAGIQANAAPRKAMGQGERK